ncbi:rhomboid family intramembrane serine protease [candidate division KSB1 bacterium]|nr:rhomboid family intramembrane serine protease [candidate division KSB1 bacterium]
MNYYERPTLQLERYGITRAVKYLIILNTVIFLLQQLSGEMLIPFLGLSAYTVWNKLYIWQLVSYMFLHVGFMHILLNMFILWMFGCEVERYYGFKNFLIYYFICGIGGGILHVLLYPNTITIGASGAIYGILVAFGVLFPNRPIMMFPFFLTLKAKHWVLIFVGIELLFGITGRQDGTAHFAHLGGMLVGFLYLKYGLKLGLVTDYVHQKSEERRLMSIARESRRKEELRKAVDQILDKINKVGYENLTDEEKQILKEASELFSKE